MTVASSIGRYGNPAISSYVIDADGYYVATNVETALEEIYVTKNPVNQGYLSGFTVTDEGGLNISWTAGTVFDFNNQQIVVVDAGTGACTTDLVNYLYWDAGTTLTIGTVEPTGNQVLVAEIYCQSNDIFHMMEMGALDRREHWVMTALDDIFPNIVTNGLTVTEDPNVVNTWDVQMAAGTFYHNVRVEHTVAAIVYSRITVMRRWYHAAGAWTSDTNAEIDITQYDNGANLVAVTPARFHRSVFFTDDAIIHWVYPQAEYATVAAAIDAPDPTLPPGIQNLPKLTAVVIRTGDAAFPAAGSDQWIDVRPMIGQAVGAPVSDHGGLSGLADDDHLQYLLIDGTRSMTGNLTFVGAQTVDGVDISAISLSNMPVAATGNINCGGQAITNVGNVDGVDISLISLSNMPAAATGNIDCGAQAITNVGNVDGVDISTISLSNMPAAATGNIDAGGQAITNVGNVDGVDVSAIVAFTTITGITNDVVADALTDTLTLASGNAILTIVGTTATDTITFTIVEAQINHDNIGGVSADDHHNQSHALTTHSDVSLADPGADQIVFWDDSDSQFEFLVANTGLSIVGNNLNCDITQYTDGLAKAACVSDLVYGAGWNGITDVAPSKNAVYDQLVTHYANADAHHAQSHTIVSHSDATLADPGADQIVFWDDSDSKFEFLIANTGLSIVGNNLNCDITQYSDALAKAACVSDVVYGAGWNGVTDVAPSKNAVYDKIAAMDTTIGAIVAFKTITGITNDVVADAVDDTLTFTSANNRLTIVGTAATDTITFTLVEGNISHDAIADVSADDHHAQSHTIVSHSDATLADPGADQIVFWDDSDSKFEFLVANTGLSIAGNNLNCDITQYTDVMAVAALATADVYVLNTSDTMSGSLTVGGLLTADGVVPEGDLADSLGTAALTWLDLFVQDIKDAAGNVILSNDGAGKIDVLANISAAVIMESTLTVQGLLTADGLVPEGDLADSLGTAALSWLNLYVQDIRDAAGNIILSNDGAGDIDQLGSVAPANGEVLTWVAANTRWEPVAAAGGGDFFKTITGITNDVVAEITDDTLTLASANNRLTIVGTAATDTITFTIVEANISHDAIADVSADDHHAQSHTIVSHSDATLADPGADQIVFWDDSDSKFEFLVANTGLSIAGNNLNCDITQYTDVMAVAAVVAENPLTLTNNLTVGGGTITFNNQGIGGDPILLCNSVIQLLNLTGGLTMTSSLVVGGTIIGDGVFPEGDKVDDLGSATKTWQDIFVVNIKDDDGAICAHTNSDTHFYVNNNLIVAGTATVDGLFPEGDLVDDLGSATKTWQDIFVQNIKDDDGTICASTQSDGSLLIKELNSDAEDNVVNMSAAEVWYSGGTLSALGYNEHESTATGTFLITHTFPSRLVGGVVELEKIIIYFWTESATANESYITATRLEETDWTDGTSSNVYTDGIDRGNGSNGYENYTIDLSDHTMLLTNTYRLEIDCNCTDPNYTVRIWGFRVYYTLK